MNQTTGGSEVTTGGRTTIAIGGRRPIRVAVSTHDRTGLKPEGDSEVVEGLRRRIVTPQDCDGPTRRRTIFDAIAVYPVDP